MKKKIPNYCKDCKLLSMTGIKDNKHNMWCCHYGTASWSCVNHCKTHNGKVIKD